MAWLNALDEAIAIDVVAEGDELLAFGYQRDQVAEVLSNFSVYLADRIASTVELACDIWLGTR